LRFGIWVIGVMANGSWQIMTARKFNRMERLR
jgi:hypothetical protein